MRSICCLADSNAFDHVGGYDGYYGIRLNGTQSFINNITGPDLGGVTIAVDDKFRHQAQINGGNLSGVSSASNAFSISSVSTTNCGATSLSLTATVAAPDSNINSVYDSFEILTPHFGLIPFYETGWNSGTNVISLQAYSPWLFTNYSGFSYWLTNDIYSELNAATILYASERLRVVKGVGFEINGTHVESSFGCTTFADVTASWNGQTSTVVKDPFFDYNTSLPQTTTQANEYCQQAWPFINNTVGFDHTLRISGGNWNPAERLTAYPTNFDTDAGARIFGSQLNGAGIFNFRFSDYGGAAYSQINTTNYYLATVARAIGIWDNDYFSPGQSGNPTNNGQAQWQLGELYSQFCGHEPCPAALPNLSPTLFALVCPSASAGSPDSYARVAYTCASLGSLGSYPPIAARTVFKSVDWNTGAPSKLYLHSGHGSTIPGRSWGQNLTQTSLGSTPNAVVTGSISGTTLCVTAVSSGAINAGDLITGTSISTGMVIIGPGGSCAGTAYQVSASQSISSETITAPSVTWAYKRGSFDLYLDATTMAWMFPGLGISINNGEGAQPYTVTGVYPYLGYVTVMWAGNNSGNPGGNSVAPQGNVDQVYSRSSGCTIGQAPFSWTAY